jgi:hypothetical protein
MGMNHDVEKLEQAQLDHEEPTVEEHQPVTDEVVQDEEVQQEQTVAEEESVVEAVTEEVHAAQEEEVKTPVQQVQYTRKNKRR